MIVCRQCGCPNGDEEAHCWNCRMPRALSSPRPLPPEIVHRLGLGRSTALARVPGWWAVSDEEIDLLGRAHVGLRSAFNDVRPTQALLDACYAELRAHGISAER